MAVLACFTNTPEDAATQLRKCCDQLRLKLEPPAVKVNHMFSGTIRADLEWVAPLAMPSAVYIVSFMTEVDPASAIGVDHPLNFL